MNNQVILWSMLILPWLTLFFMKKEDIKRWMPLALFTMVTGTIIIDSGVGLGIFEIRENTYPLKEIISYNYGVLPVVTMWIFKYTYGRFWLCAVIELIFSVGFIRIIHPWLHRRGILVWTDPAAIGGLGAFVTTVVHFVSIYVYQMWQEGIFARTNKDRI